MRVVLDTNVLVSAVLTPNGLSATILAAWRDGRFQLCSSDDLLEEVASVVTEEAVVGKYALSSAEVQGILNEIRDFATMPSGPMPPIDIVRDPKDNMVIECAVACEADLIVTNDDDLLSLKSYQNVGIASIRDFLRTLGLE